MFKIKRPHRASKKVVVVAWLAAQNKVNANDMLQFERSYRTINPDRCDMHI